MSGWTGLRRLASVSLLALCLAPATASALEFTADGITLELLDKTGEPETRAGAHPDRFIQSFEFVHTEGSEDAKEVVIDLPPGLSGNPNAVPPCPRRQFSELTLNELCPGSQTETSRIGTFYSPSGESIPLLNVEPGPNELAVFGARQLIMPVKIVGSLRPGDQGLSLRLSDIPPSLFTGGKMEVWGVPADHQQGTEIPRKSLITTPTRCDGQPLVVTLRANSWQQPDVWISGTADSGHELTDCGGLPFAPSMGFSLGDHSTDAPSGAQIDVTVPQDEAPDARASAMVRGLSIAMPTGVTFSPGGAAGLSACSDTQFGLGSAEDPSCPPSSRVGSVELDLAGGGKQLIGTLFLGQEHPNDRFRLLVSASASGSQLKLPGSLKADSKTGRVTMDLKDLPQVAFQSLHLRFNGGPRALLATPLTCGAAPASAQFTPYSGGPSVDWNGSVDVTPAGGGACAGTAPFAPSFSGGSTGGLPGRPTSFTVTVRRQDGEQLPERLTIALPQGLSAALGTVDTCAAPQVQAASCSSASRIGGAVAQLGPGEHPARIDGDVFLTGPYRGAPFGVVLVFKAAFGPFDLGTLLVRGALRVDLLSGQVKVEMDSLPTVFEGLPVRFQTIGLDLDRPGFMFNPTSCAPTQAVAHLRSQSGTTATASSPFALHGCIDLPFHPGFSAALGSSKQLHEGGRPSLRISMRMPAGGANVRSVDVRLPAVLKLDSSGLNELCARRKATEGRCPRSARIGTANALTPLLRQPMNGFLYLVQPRGERSPDIWASLEGQGLEMNLRAETAVRHGHLETKFVDLPDFPLGSLSLRLGAGGVIELKRRPCGRLVAPTELGAQNGAEVTLRTRVTVRSSCNGNG
jgi:hypothetical protein